MCVQIATKKGRPSTSQLITGRSLVTATAGPQSLTTQVCYPWRPTGHLYLQKSGLTETVFTMIQLSLRVNILILKLMIGVFVFDISCF